MTYDLFVSYSRRDNVEGRVTQLVGRIQADFAAFAGRPLLPFFDISEIRGMDDWRHRILQGLRESRLLLACLSPAYLASEYCEWEFNEYAKNESRHGMFGDGIAPIYFVAIPGWRDKDFDSRAAAWVTELRRRQHFDLQAWFSAGEQNLRDAAVEERLRELKQRLAERVIRMERVQRSLGNVISHNPHFVGRIGELRHLREATALGRVGVLTAVQGMGGVGKTALAVEYAHAFAHEYGGGRWQVRCEGRSELTAALAQLGAPLQLAEQGDEQSRAQRALAELRRLAEANEPHRTLLILDNVDRAELLAPATSRLLPAEDWLHVIVTTRLGPSELHGEQRDRVFLPVDVMSNEAGVELIESYQPAGRFASAAEREAAAQIVELTGGLPVAVEIAAVYLGHHAGDVTCSGYLKLLQSKGLQGLDVAAKQGGSASVPLSTTLAPTLQRLDEAAHHVVTYAALLPPDYIVPQWLRALAAEDFAEMARDAEPGYPDPWIGLTRRLLEGRLLQAGAHASLPWRMHRLVQETIRQSLTPERLQEATRRVNRQLAIIKGQLEDQVSESEARRQRSAFLKISSDTGRLEDELQVFLNMTRNEVRMWHPETPEIYKELGPQEDYATVYRFPCCGKFVVSDQWPSQMRADGCKAKT